MEQVFELLIIFSMKFFIQSAPLQSEITVKPNIVLLKKDPVPQTFGVLFAKIPQELKPTDELRKGILSKAYFLFGADLGTGCSNQIAKFMIPLKYSHKFNDTELWNSFNLLNLPLIQQPYDDYKILVATAPPNVKFGGPDRKDLVVYVVFPEDSLNLSSPSNLPKIYFVSERNGKLDVNKREQGEPIFVIDSNRTVTGIKSKEVSKYVKFKNKLTQRYNYMLTP